MSSGIYQLTFANGETYVGKSLDLKRRWGQHADKLTKNTAAKNMLQAFEASGCKYPTAKILLECHPDVLDEYENLFINQLQPTLNTQRPEARSQADQDALLRHAEAGRAIYSVPVIMVALENTQAKCVVLEFKAARIHESLEELEGDYEELEYAWDNRALQELRKNSKWNQLQDNLQQLQTKCNELQQFKTRVDNSTWFERLFKLY